MGRPIEEPMLFDLAKNLLAQVVVDGRAWPCAMISLSVGGFEDGITGNKGIGGFLLRGEEAKALRAASPAVTSAEQPDRPSKRRKVEDTRINNFFLRQEESTGDAGTDVEPTDFDELPSAQLATMPAADAMPSTTQRLGSPIRLPEHNPENNSFSFPSSNPDPATAPPSSPPIHTDAVPVESGPSESASSSIFTCPKCGKKLLSDQQEEHEDYHFAQELQEQDEAERRAQQQQARASSTNVPQKPRPPASGRGGKAQGVGRGRGRPPGSGAGGNASAKGLEKGQKTLAFGH